MVDSVTVADNALSVMRMSNLAFSSLLIQETGANITLHIACRDRNLIGLQSHLFGAAALGIRNILPITGDPVATQAYKGSSGVFDMSSYYLIKMIKAMNEGETSPRSDGELRPDFCIGGAFNSGMKRLDAEAKKTARKVDAGTCFVMTQPVYEAERAHEILDLLEPLGVKVFIGVMPLVSERNAEFLHNEVPGINVPEGVREAMRGKSGAAGREQGMALARELIDGFAARSRALYLIPSLDRFEMAAELTRHALAVKPHATKGGA